MTGYQSKFYSLSLVDKDAANKVLLLLLFKQTHLKRLFKFSKCRYRLYDLINVTIDL